MYINQDYINNDELKIADYLDNPYINIKNQDFTIIGLNKQPPVFDKGRKKEASFTSDSIGQDVVVKKTFIDKEYGIDVLFEWYKTDGTVGLSKTQEVHMSKEQLGDFFRQRRQRQVSSLIEGAKGTPVESLVGAIFAHYSNEVEEYLQVGDNVLENAIEVETDPTILGYLAVMLSETDSVKDRIIYQIN